MPYSGIPVILSTISLSTCMVPPHYIRRGPPPLRSLNQKPLWSISTWYQSTPLLLFRPAPPDPLPAILLAAAPSTGRSPLGGTLSRLVYSRRLRHRDFTGMSDTFTRCPLLTRRHVDALTPVSPSSTTYSSSLLLLWRTRVLRRPLCRALNRLQLLHPWSHPTPRRPPSSTIYKTRRPPSMAPTISRGLPPSSGSLRSTVASPISPMTRLPSRHPTSRLGSSRIAPSPPGC